MELVKRRGSNSWSERVANTLVIVAFAMYLFCSAFHFSTSDLTSLPLLEEWVTSTYEILTFALLVVAMTLRRWRWSPLGLVAVATMLVIFVLSGIRGHMRSVEILLLFLLAMRGMDFLSLVKTSFWTLFVLLVVFLVGTRVFGAPEWWDLLDGGYVSGRGAVHPNAFSILIFNLTLCMSMLVDRRRHLFLVVAGILASTAFVYFVQHSGTTVILLMLLAALVLLERWLPMLSKLICKQPIFFASLAIVACGLTAFMLVSAAIYSPDNGILVAIDRILHGRISLPSVVVHEYGGFPLLGRPMTVWTGSAHTSRMLGVPLMMLDSTYTRYALISGLLVVLCVLGLFLRTAYVIGKRCPSLFLWGVFMMMLLYMVMEYDPSNLCFNATLPLLAYGLCPLTVSVDEASEGRGRLC